jgi:hypothetical protein
MRTAIVPAQAWHAVVIGQNPRPADVAELAASSGSTPEEAMVRGLNSSVRAFTGLVDDEPVCMFGASPYSILGGVGAAWMIGSDALRSMRVQRALLRESAAALDLLQSMFPEMLYNFVDQRNTCAIRWLTWLGFTFLDPVIVGHEKLPFLPFYRKAPDAQA